MSFVRGRGRGSIHVTHSLRFWMLGEAKGLRRAAMRTSCLRPPPCFTPRPAAVSGVLPLPLEPGVRPALAADLGVRLGVWYAGEADSSPSQMRPGVATKHWSRENSLLLCNF